MVRIERSPWYRLMVQGALGNTEGSEGSVRYLYGFVKRFLDVAGVVGCRWGSRGGEAVNR